MFFRFSAHTFLWITWPQGHSVFPRRRKGKPRNHWCPLHSLSFKLHPTLASHSYRMPQAFRHFLEGSVCFSLVSLSAVSLVAVASALYIHYHNVVSFLLSKNLLTSLMWYYFYSYSLYSLFLILFFFLVYSGLEGSIDKLHKFNLRLMGNLIFFIMCIIVH